jgi:hypothetical protein
VEARRVCGGGGGVESADGVFGVGELVVILGNDFIFLRYNVVKHFNNDCLGEQSSCLGSFLWAADVDLCNALGSEHS